MELYDSLGHNFWVKLKDQLGQPMDPALAAAKPKRQQTIAERDAAKAKAESLAEQNRQALAKVAAATVLTNDTEPAA